MLCKSSTKILPLLLLHQRLHRQNRPLLLQFLPLPLQQHLHLRLRLPHWKQYVYKCIMYEKYTSHKDKALPIIIVVFITVWCQIVLQWVRPQVILNDLKIKIGIYENTIHFKIILSLGC